MNEIAVLSKFLPQRIAERLAGDSSLARVGGEVRDITILFFSMGRGRPEAGDIEFLIRYLGEMTDVVMGNRGCLDKYIGDTVMAFWNGHDEDPAHRLNACLSALRCRDAARRLHPGLSVTGGLNSGGSFVGLIGSDRRLQFSAAGDAVTMASRMEGANRFFGSELIATEACVRRLEDRLELRLLGNVRVVGSDKPQRIFELLAEKGGLSGPWTQAMPSYRRGVEAFLSGDFETAGSSFATVLKLLPQDRVSSLYLNCCRDFQAIPPTGDWDTFNLTRT